jgi:hypothetical protein
MTTPITPSAPTDRQIIAWLAVEVMGWHYIKNGAIADGWWADFRLRSKLSWNPLTNWNHFRQIEERLMEDGKSELLKRYLKYFEGKGHYMGSCLLERCQALLSALDSLKENE